MTWNDIIITAPIWPPVIYYIVSIIVGVLLYVGKYYVHRCANFTVFMLYGLVVGAAASVQMCLFRFGEDFAKDILRINLDVYGYDSIYNGAFIFFVIYIFSMPIKFK